MTAIALPVQAQEEDFVDHFDDPALPGWERSPGVLATDGILLEITQSILRAGEMFGLLLSFVGRDKANLSSVPGSVIVDTA